MNENSRQSYRVPALLLGVGAISLTLIFVNDSIRERVLVRDAEIVQVARRDARQLLQSDPGLAAAGMGTLRDRVLKRYGKVLQLGDVG